MKKGIYNELCNRTACQKPGAVYYNHSTRLYYCGVCAGMINSVNPESHAIYGHELCTLGQPHPGPPQRGGSTSGGAPEAPVFEGDNGAAPIFEPKAEDLYTAETLRRVVDDLTSTVVNLKAEIKSLVGINGTLMKENALMGDLLKSWERNYSNLQTKNIQLRESNTSKQAVKMLEATIMAREAEIERLRCKYADGRTTDPVEFAEWILKTSIANDGFNWWRTRFTDGIYSSGELYSMYKDEIKAEKQK